MRNIRCYRRAMFSIFQFQFFDFFLQIFFSVFPSISFLCFDFLRFSYWTSFFRVIYPSIHRLLGVDKYICQTYGRQTLRGVLSWQLITCIQAIKSSIYIVSFIHLSYRNNEIQHLALKDWVKYTSHIRNNNRSRVWVNCPVFKWSVSITPI